MSKICQKCEAEFPLRWKNPETNKFHNLANRKFCFTCSPFMLHNTKLLTTGPKIAKTKRVCPRCKTEKLITEFYSKRNEDGNSSYCKPCTTEQTLERQRELKRLAIEYKGGQCGQCGYDKCPGAMEFHHVGHKDFTIANARLTSFAKIKDELDKCVLLCSNCHREEHYDWYALRDLNP